MCFLVQISHSMEGRTYYQFGSSHRNFNSLGERTPNTDICIQLLFWPGPENSTASPHYLSLCMLITPLICPSTTRSNMGNKLRSITRPIVWSIDASKTSLYIQSKYPHRGSHIWSSFGIRRLGLDLLASSRHYM